MMPPRPSPTCGVSSSSRRSQSTTAVATNVATETAVRSVCGNAPKARPTATAASIFTAKAAATPAKMRAGGYRPASALMATSERSPSSSTASTAANAAVITAPPLISPASGEARTCCRR
jgi:hypothetical protein